MPTKKIRDKQCTYGVVSFITLFVLSGLILNAQESLIAKINVRVTVGEPQVSPIPQSWIDDFFKDIDSKYEVTPISDYDGDGQFDYIEYYAGTDPTDSTSQLKMITPELSGENAIVSWDSSDSNDPEPRVYRLFRSGSDALGILTNPNATIFSLQNESSVITDLGEIDSQGTTTTYEDDGDNGTGVKSKFPLFYRVFLSKPEPKLP